MAKASSPRNMSSAVAFHLVGVLGLLALGCGGSSAPTNSDAGSGDGPLDRHVPGDAGDALVTSNASDTSLPVDVVLAAPEVGLAPDGIGQDDATADLAVSEIDGSTPDTTGTSTGPETGTEIDGAGGTTGDDSASATGGTSGTGGTSATGGTPATGGTTVAVDAGADGSIPDASAQDIGAPDSSDAIVTGPVASFPSTPISLGLVACGTSAAASTITIANAGTSVLTVTAAVSGAPFAVAPGTATIAAGDSQALSLTAAVPSTATAGTALTGTLTVTTNDPAHSSTPISLAVTPQGGTLVWDAVPHAADFGTTALDAAATPITLALRNTGNAQITVTPTAVSAPFTLSPTTAQQIAANHTLSLTVGFDPTSTSAVSATSALTIDGPACGTSVSSVSLSGQGALSVLSGWPSQALDFGLNPCGGAAPAPQSFTLTNTGMLSAHITSATFGKTLGYATDAAGKTIPSQGTLQVQITAPAIGSTSAVPGVYSDALTIVTDVQGDTPHEIDVTEGAKGAILAWNVTAGFGAFGTVPVGTTATQNFEVDNNGNDGASVTVMTTTPFSIGGSTFSLAGASTHTDTLSFAPSVLGQASKTLGVSVSNTVLCAPLPAALNVGGVGQGGLSLSTQTMGFAAACGTQADSKTLQVTNEGITSIGWTAALGQGVQSPFRINGGITASGTFVNQHDATVITVQPSQLSQYGSTVLTDTLTISPVGSSLDSPHTVTLTMTPQGDVIVLSPLALQFGTVPVTPSPGQSADLSFNITNNANAGSPDAQITLTPSDTTHYSIVESSPITVPAQTTTTVHVIFAPGTNPSTDAVERDGEIQLGFGSDVLCATTPTNPTVTGTGTLAQVVLSTSTLTFGSDASDLSGLVACGNTGPAQTVTLSNLGTQDYHVTSAVLSNTNYYVDPPVMVPATGLVPANGGQLTLTVAPKAIDTTTSIVPDTKYGGTLTIHTNAAFENPAGHPVTLVMGAKGIIIDNTLATTSWAFGSESQGSTKLYNVPIRNHGNINASVALTSLTTPGIFGLHSNPTTVLAGDGSADVITNIQGTFTPNTPDQVWTDNGVLTVSSPAGEKFCQPLPASWVTPTITLSGSSPPAL